MPQKPPARRQLYDDDKEWGSIRDLDFETFSQELDASERFREGVKREFTRQAGRHGIEIDDAFDFDTIFGIKKKKILAASRQFLQALPWLKWLRGKKRHKSKQ